MAYIGKADVEFYQGGLVLVVAKAIATKPYDTLSYRSRQRVLNKALDAVHDLLNDNDVKDKLRLFLKHDQPMAKGV